jgi:hypothetical protein
MKSLHAMAMLLVSVTVVAVPLAGMPFLSASPVALQTESCASMSWEALTRQPTRHIGARVRVVGQFQAQVEQWNSYLTRFTPQAHSAWQFWTDEQHLWLRAEYEAPRMRVFAPKEGRLARELAQLGMQQRVELELIVRECFLELPWAEVVGVRPLEESVSEASAFHAARAIELGRTGAWKLALSELDSALVADLPAHSRTALESLQAQWREQVPNPR